MISIDMTGMPIQTTLDCGSETAVVYGLVNVLWYITYMSKCLVNHEYIYNSEEFSPNLPVDEVPAHCFLHSIHNTVIDCGWLNLCLQWGDNIIVTWEEGEGIYNPSNPEHWYVHLLCRL